MSRFRKGLQPGLYAITDPRLLPGERLLAGVEAALRGGAVLVQYRDKEASAEQRLHRARDLLGLCRQAAVPLIINDDPELARRIGADGVHLGQDDVDLGAARALLGPEAIIGATCHGSLALAQSARRAGADYLAFGSFFASATKPDAMPADPRILTQARDLGLPITAIGGITTARAPQLLRRGADLLAVVSDLFAAPDITARAREFSDLFRHHGPTD